MASVSRSRASVSRQSSARTGRGCGPAPMPYCAHEVAVSVPYDARAGERPVNLSLNEDLVVKARAVTDNLSERVELLLAAWLEAEHMKPAEADRRLEMAVAAWNTFGDEVGSFADEHSTL